MRSTSLIWSLVVISTETFSLHNNMIVFFIAFHEAWWELYSNGTGNSARGISKLSWNSESPHLSSWCGWYRCSWNDSQVIVYRYSNVIACIYFGTRLIKTVQKLKGPSSLSWVVEKILYSCYNVKLSVLQKQTPVSVLLIMINSYFLLIVIAIVISFI